MVNSVGITSLLYDYLLLEEVFGYVESVLFSNEEKRAILARMEEVFGYIESILFSNEENGFVIAKIKEPKKQEVTTIVGTMPTIITALRFF